MAKSFLFKQQVLLGKGKVGHKNSVGKIYSKGVHLVSDEHQKDPTFLHFEKGGLIEPFVKKEQGVLKPAESPEAQQAAANAKASQLEPDAEIGGEQSSPAPKKKGR